MSFPRLTRAQVREIDRRATADYGIPSIVLMENAARSVAEVAMQMLESVGHDPRVSILCGGGNNGGDGLAVARHLYNRGVDVIIWECWTDVPTGDAGINYQISRNMKISSSNCYEIHKSLGKADLWIDAMFGTGLTRPIKEPLAGIIEMLNADRAPILAIDVPSGMDADTGEPLGPCIRAKRTVTFVASKKGFDHPNAKCYTGFISIADIGIPPELVKSVISPI